MQVSHPMNSIIYGDSYSTPEMRDVFDQTNVQRQRLAFEAALAREQAGLGMIPDEAADEIEAVARRAPDLAAIAEITAATGNDIVALIRVAGRDMGEKGREYIHFGATSQDVHITGQALILKQAALLLEQDLAELEMVIAALAAKHRDSIMAGRTHGQHALPITFGYKVSEWAYQMRLQRQRLVELAPRLLVASVKGGVGSHAVWGPEGLVLERRVCERLGLYVSPINVQPSEERYVEYLNWCSGLATLIGRICSEIRGLHRTEVAEVREAFATGIQVGSSTMPHKRNAEWSEAIQGIAYKVQTNSLAMTRVFQEHERDGTRNPAEHLLLAESSQLTHKMVMTLTEGLRGLHVDVARMRANLDLTGGLIVSEAVMFALAEKTGKKETAHHCVYRCAMEAFERSEDFATVLSRDPEVARWLSPGEIQAVLDPLGYLGTAREQVDAVLDILKQPVPTWQLPGERGREAR